MVALFLAAQIAAHAQTAMGDGHGNVTINGSGGARFSFSPSSTPPLAAGGMLTVEPGANLTSAAGFYELQSSSPATLTNDGTVSMTNSGGSTANGIYFATLSSGNVTIINAATGTISGVSNTSSYARGVWDYFQQTGNFTLTNSGSIYASSAGNIGIGVVAHTGSGASTLTNNAGATISATTASNAYGAVDLVADSGPIMVTNKGTISGTGGTAPGIAVLTSSGGGDISITNSGLLEAQLPQSTDSGGLDGVQVTQSLAGNASVSNTGTITADGTAGEADAIQLHTTGTGALTVTNAGAIYAAGATAKGVSAGDSAAVIIDNNASITAATDTGYAAAVWASADTSLALTNNGTLTSAANSGLSVAVVADAAAVTINNRGQIVAVSGNNSGSGIYSITQNFVLNNSGSITGGMGQPTGAGVTVLGGGTVVNTGTITADIVGVELRAPSTVTNSGSGVIVGGIAAIVVPSGSTVNLAGKSSTFGLIYGGVNIASTSVLNFDLTVPTAQLKMDKAALNLAISLYESEVAVEDPAGSVTGPVVDINGVGYQWENFGEVRDELRSAQLYADTPGFHGLGAAIDNFSATSPAATRILGALGAIAQPGLPGALGQLSPQSLAVLRNIADDGAGFLAANVNDHLANQRDGVTGFDTSGFAVNSPGVDPVLQNVQSHLLAWNPAPAAPGLISDSPAALVGGDPKDMKSMCGVCAPPVDRWSAFISGSVILANLDNTFANTGDADYTTGSVLAGADYRLDDHFTVGVLFDYSHTSADLDGNGSKATVDSYAPGVYASYVDGPWYANGLASYAFNSTTDDREVTIPGIAGDNHGAADGGAAMANLTGGYEFRRGDFKFGPVATLRYVHLHVDALQEDGPTSLAIGGQDDDSLRTQFGVEARYSRQAHTCWGLMTFTPHLEVDWQHEYMDNSDGITAAFNNTGGGSFVVQGAAPERDSAFIDLGLDAGVARDVTLFVDYQAQAGQDHFLAQSAQGGVRVGF